MTNTIGFLPTVSVIEAKDVNNMTNLRDLLDNKQFISPGALSVIKRTSIELTSEYKFTETLSGLFRIGCGGLL